MVPNWKSWCRLCAHEDPANTHICFYLENELESPFLEAIRKYFSINVSLEEWPQTICPQCHQFVTNFMSFIHRTSKVQAMFAELLQNFDESMDPEQLKIQYELHELDDLELELKLFSNNSVIKENSDEQKPNKQSIDLEEIEYIDEEMLDPVPQIKTEDFDDNNVEEDVFEENEWHAGDELPEPPTEPDEDVKSTTKWEDDEEKEKEEIPKVKKRGRPRLKPEIFACTACPTHFVSFSKYKKHMLDEHNVTVAYNCSECSKSFTTQKALRSHELNHRKSAAVVVVKEKSKIPCPCCDKKFTKVSAVQSHIQMVHSGEKSFICEECGKACRTFGALKEHKLTHTEETPFKCRYCDKSFKNNPRLKTHLDTHNETNYICTSCGLQLNTRRTLKMHMLVHSDQKRHKCDFCGNEFKRAKALKNHLILHTGLKPYTCNFCDKTFANGSNCRTHKKKCHPAELAAMEAAGTKVIASNIPKLENLRAVTSNKSFSMNIEPLGGSLVGLGREFGSTVSIVSIADDAESVASLPKSENNWQHMPNS